MLNKILSVLLIGLVMNVTVSFGQTQDEKELKRVEKIKTQIAKRGTGTDAKLKLKLKNGTRLKGYVSEIKSDSFVIIVENTGTSSEIQYGEVSKASSNGSNDALLILGIVGGAALIIGIIATGARGQ